MRNAWSGQMRTHTEQLMQWLGRSSCGKGPTMPRQSVGQTMMQSPQPVQRVSSTCGSSIIRASFRQGRLVHQGGNHLEQGLARPGWGEYHRRPEVPAKADQAGVVGVGRNDTERARREKSRTAEQAKFAFQVAPELDHEDAGLTAGQQPQTGLDLARFA